MNPEQMTTQMQARRITARIFILSALVALLVCFAITFVLAITSKNIGSTQLTVIPGSSVIAITSAADKAGIVRSGTILYALLTYVYDPTRIYAGTYVFSGEENVFEVAQKLAGGDVETQTAVITIPEGSSRKEIAKIAKQKLTNFDDIHFLEITKGKEGLLFPETYYVPPTFTPEELAGLLEKTHTEKMQSLDFTGTDLTLQEVLILASVIEREANSEESMRTVSGILQNRLAIDMPLQADASIEYILDKPLKELTPDDLKIDSPYNTYLNRGLPPTPIGNPGLGSVRAVLEPTKSPYLFYITGNDGSFYYAKTYAEHQRNIERYLR